MKNFIALIKSLTSKTHERLGKILIEKSLQISTAESCTGGLLSSRLTDVSGSSAYTKTNFITYSNEAKSTILGVSENIIEKYGAVSEQCAYEMAAGLIKKTKCDIAVCTTGIAGPMRSRCDAGIDSLPRVEQGRTLRWHRCEQSDSGVSEAIFDCTGAYLDKTVGLIYISVAFKGKITVKQFKLNPEYNRKNMKFMFTEKALKMTLDIIKNYQG